MFVLDKTMSEECRISVEKEECGFIWSTDPLNGYTGLLPVDLWIIIPWVENTPTAGCCCRNGYIYRAIFAIKEEANVDTIQLAFVMVCSSWGRGGKTKLFGSFHAPFISSRAICRRIASLDIHSLGGLGCFAEAPGWVQLREQKVLFWTPTAMKATRHQDGIHTHFQPLNCQPLDFVVNSFFL